MIDTKSQDTLITLGDVNNLIKNLADRIYVLENGVFTSQGNHQKLLETSNFYSEFWEEIHQ